MSVRCTNTTCPQRKNCERPDYKDESHIKNEAWFNYESNEAQNHPCFKQKKTLDK